jgi:hypothetical protein
VPRATAGTASEMHLALAVLSDTPKQIARIARGCSAGQLHRRPAPDAWSARNIVAHLRACAEVWGRSIDRMIETSQTRHSGCPACVKQPI